MCEKHIKLTQAQQELFFTNIMWFLHVLRTQLQNQDAADFALWHMVQNKTVLTSALSLLSGPKTLTWTHDLWPFLEILPARGLNEPENHHH